MSAATQVADYLDKQTEAKTVTEIALDTGVKRATVERVLRDLRKLGDVTEIGVTFKNEKTWGAATQAERDAQPFTIDTENEDEDEAPEGWTSVDTSTEGDQIWVTSPPEDEAATRMNDEDWEASARVAPADDKESDTVTTTETVEAPTTDVAAEPKERGEQKYFHGRGALEAELLAFFREHPDKEYSPHNIHKSTDMSGTGAIAYACEALVKKGKLNRTSDQPKRYGYLAESEWPVVEPKESAKDRKAREKAEKKAADEAAKAAEVTE